ncbi:MAG: acyltransferase [Rhizomicrobium sp.]|nr:acyltransferase [Rhizomicrobium sp.]
MQQTTFVGPTDNQTAQRPKYYDALDGFRGIAVLLIAFYHVPWPNHFIHSGFVANSYLMVDLFFMLSGFVILASSPKHAAAPAKIGNFLAQRFFRIYPLHLAVLAAFVGLELFKLWSLRHGAIVPAHIPFSGANSVPALIANLFLVQGLGIFSTLTWNCPSWYISCLFVAYSLFAIGAFAGILKNKIAFPTAILLALSGYVLLAVTRGTLNITYDFGIVRCLCGFFLGMAIFQLSAKREGHAAATPYGPSLEIALVVALVLAMSFASGWQVIFVIPVFGLMIAVFQRGLGPVSTLLTWPVMRFLSKISYSIYMVQFFIFLVTSTVLHKVLKFPMLPDPKTGVDTLNVSLWVGDIFVGIDLVLIVGISTATYFLIEEPARLFGKRVLASLQK